MIPSFEYSLLDSSLRDAVANMAELGIDSCLNEGVFKSIPIVGTLIGVAKTGQNIYERNLLVQTFEFIKGFNEETVSEEKVNEYRARFHSDQSLRERELGRALVILNATVDTQKSRILGRLYSRFVDRKIDWSEFCELSDVVNRLFVADLELLMAIHDGEIKSTDQCDSYKAERLSSLGLVSLIQNKVEFRAVVRCGVRTETAASTKAISMTGLGEKLILHGI